MKIKYECEMCGKEFCSAQLCRSHEANHLSGAEKIKYELHSKGANLCDYCDHSYYAYGCEQDCEFPKCSFKNGYKDFKPVEPLHDKRAHGGV